jgi:hypothetical protein
MQPEEIQAAAESLQDQPVELSSPGPTPMTLEELQGVVVPLIQNAADYIDETESPVRAEATKYFRGEPFGDEEPGRSQVVTQDVRDSIQLMIPTLMRTFFGSEKALEFVPTGPEDVRLAEQLTEYVIHILKENDCFTQFQFAFQDALLKRCGIIKVDWKELEDVKTYSYTGLGDEELQVLLMDNNAEDVEVQSYPDPDFIPGPPPPPQIMPDGSVVQMDAPPPPMLHNATVTRRTIDGRVHINALPPEEFLIDRTARSLEDANIVAHRRYLTVSELAQMGYDPEEMEEYAGQSDELAYNTESYERNPSGFLYYDQRTDDAMRKVLYIEAYVKVDTEGTGIAHLRRICTVGTAYNIVMNEPVAEQPFCLFTPYPEAHRWRGQSVFDLTRDVQNIKSHVLRNMLDSLALSIFPRLAIVDGQVNIDDALSTEMGSIIRQRSPGAVQQLTLPFVGQNAAPILAYMDEIKESRTGMNRASAGLNPEHMQSTTAVAISAQINAAQMQLDLVSRNFAETMKKIFHRVQRLIMRHQDRPRMVRLSGDFVQMDPRTWNSHFDVEVNVALGAGSDQERVATLQMFGAKQEEILKTLGPNNPIVGLPQYMNTLRKIVELSGFKDTQNYVGNPNYNPQAEQMEEEEPTPEQVLAQVQAQQIQAQMQIEAARLQQDREEMFLKDDRDRDKMEAEMQLKVAELESRYNTSIDVAAIKAAIERERMRKTDA